MKTPRFTVGSVTGFPINNPNTVGSNQKPSTLWYVHDSAIGYQILKEFRGPGSEKRARAFADELNSGVVRSEPWHGTTKGFKKHWCRCEPCRSAQAEYMRNYMRKRRAAA